MAKIKTLKDKGEVFYPQTHIEAVVDDNGNTVNELIDNIENKIPAKVSQLENDKNYALATNVQANTTAINNEIARATQAENDAIEKGRQLALRSLFIAAGAQYNDTDNHIVKDTPWNAYVDSVDYKAQWSLDVVSGSVQTLTYGGKSYEYVDDNGTWKVVARVGNRLIWDDTKVIHRKGYYYLNGLGDITEEQMMEIYNEKEAIPKLFTKGFISQSPTLRTLLPITSARLYDYSTSVLVYYASRCTGLETVFFNTKVKSIANLAELFSIQNGANMFNGDTKLRYVQPINAKDMLQGGGISFQGCTLLKYMSLRNLKVSYVGIQDCPLISKKSMLETISYAAPTSAITITLHHDAYIRLTSDTEVVTALSEKNASLAGTNGKISLVCAIHSDEIIPNA